MTAELQYFEFSVFFSPLQWKDAFLYFALLKKKNNKIEIFKGGGEDLLCIRPCSHIAFHGKNELYNKYSNGN